MQHPLKSLAPALLAVLPLTALGLYGCGLINSVQATKALAATVLATPTFTVSNIGLPVAITVPPQTVAQVFFGKEDSDPTKQPTGLADATVTLGYGGQSFTLPPSAATAGDYELSTPEDASFNYQEGVHYTLTVTEAGTTYTAEVDGPYPQRMEQFEAAGDAPLSQKTGQQLLLTRANVLADGGFASLEDVAFVTVMKLDASAINLTTQQLNSNIPSTYSNMPQTPLDLLDLIANDSLWKQKIITIPGTAFPDAATTYLVTIATVRKGSTSDNLFTASGFLVGLADVKLVQTP